MWLNQSTAVLISPSIRHGFVNCVQRRGKGHIGGQVRHVRASKKGPFRGKDLSRVERIRNIGIVAHIDAGHVDFTIEVKRCVRALDACVLLLDASAGVQPQTVAVWREANKRNLPMIAFANKMDKMAASVSKCTESIKRQLDILPVTTQILAPGCSFHGENVDYGSIKLIDLVSGTVNSWRDDNSGNAVLHQEEIQPSSSQYAELFLSSRDEMVDLICEHHGELAELVLQHESLRHSEVIGYLPTAIRQLTLDGKIMPLFIGSALKQLGVECILDGVVDYLPSPLDFAASINRFYPEKSLCALAFKTEFDKHLGELTFIRIYSGELRVGDSFFNATQGETEIVNSLYRPDCDQLIPIESAKMGQICIASGLKSTITGDTLTQSENHTQAARAAYKKMSSEYGSSDDTQVISMCNALGLLEGIDIPEPVVFCSIEAPSLREQQKFDLALSQLCRQDPSMRIRRDADTGATVLEAQGELHVEIIKERLLREYSVDAYIGPLQVAYREAASDVAAAAATLEETSSGGHVPLLKCLSLKQVLSVDRSDWQRAITAGCISGTMQGPLLGFRVFDTRLVVTRVEATGGRVSYPLISAAAASATHRALEQATTRLIEPIMLVEVSLDSEGTGRSAILSDLSARRGHILQASGAAPGAPPAHQHENNSIVAKVPLAQLDGWSQVARTLTRGTASLNLRTDSYEPMNPVDQEKVLSQDILRFS